ncbi:MAG: hypothetical protein LBI16_05630 [Burkholderiales bacterium]|jgi:hypothetical protein|nr:hypothetical protein [Burkholderiales bacterium]
MAQAEIDWEEVFVNNFLKKESVERALFLLRSPKKRRDFFQRVHPITDYRVDVPRKEALSIEEILKKYGAKDSCYVLTGSGSLDKKIVSLEEGLEYGYRVWETFLICTENLVLWLPDNGMHYPATRVLFRGQLMEKERKWKWHPRKWVS